MQNFDAQGAPGRGSAKSLPTLFAFRYLAPERPSAARAALRGQARSYACFGPVMPVGFSRERPGAHLDIAPYKQGGRARLAQEGLARNKRRRGRRSIFQAPTPSRRTPVSHHAAGPAGSAGRLSMAPAACPCQHGTDGSGTHRPAPAPPPGTGRPGFPARFR